MVDKVDQDSEAYTITSALEPITSMLLSWGTLYPHGTSKIASIRFALPVKIKSIRLCPKGQSLLLNNPGAVGQTEPEAFALTVFLSAQALPSTNETRIRATNHLLSTTLYYPGGMREFSLDLGLDYATRVLILQGDFSALTMAVYGDPPGETPMDEISTSTNINIQPVKETLLLPILDPINLPDPILLSKKLLELTHNPPTLPLLVRLQFCLKLQDQITVTDDIQFLEWDAILDNDISGSEWLERAATTLNWPVAENVDPEVLKRFSAGIMDSIADKTNDCLFIFAGLIRRASAQPPIVVNTLFNDLNLSDIFESHLLDRHIIERLHDAAAHPTIARSLGTPSMIANVDSFINLHKTNLPAKQAVIALLDRIRGWEEFEKVIQGGSPDIPFLMSWVRKLTSEDITSGVFLNYLLSEQFSTVSKESFLSIDGSHSIPSWSSASLATLPEFLGFLKAFVGVSSTLAVFSWAVDLNAYKCVEKVLSIICLWQTVPIYQGITNHLLILSRVLYRLEDVLRQSSDIPDVRIQYGEQILSHLLDHVETMASPDLARLVDALPDANQSSLSYARRTEMSRMVSVAENGLDEAIPTIVRFSPDDSINILHVALLVIERALEDRENGVWNVARASWDQDLHGLEYYLLDMLDHFVTLIRSQFLVLPPPPLPSAVLTQLVNSSHVILRIMTRLSPNEVLPLRLVRSLVVNILDLFISTDAIDSTYPFGNHVRHAARLTRPTCAETLTILCRPNPDARTGPSIGEIALRTLLQSALCAENDDPVVRVEQVFWLLDLVLPLPMSDSMSNNSQERYWIKEVIPTVLPELSRFCRALTTEYQLQLVERLVNLDHDEIGLGQWFMDQELSHILHVLQLSETNASPEKTTVYILQIGKSLRFLTGFLEAFPFGKHPSVYQGDETLGNLFKILNDTERITALPPSYIAELALRLTSDMDVLTVAYRADLARILLAQAKYEPTIFSKAITILLTLDRVDDVLMRDSLIRTLGRTVNQLAFSHYEFLEEDIVHCFEWLRQYGTPGRRIQVHFSELIVFDHLATLFKGADASSILVQLDELRSSFIYSDESSPLPDGPPSELSKFSFQDLKNSFGHRPTTPPTPHLNGESIFKMATTSPITTLYNSAKNAYLAKNYQQNEFRQLSARQNTSRRPSVHVDEFEQEMIVPAADQVSVEYGQLLPPLKFE